MRTFTTLFIIVLALSLTSCACRQKCMMKHCQKKVTEERIAVLAADSAFARASVLYGAAEAFNMFLADDAMQMPEGRDPVFGRDTIYQRMKASKKRYLLDWQPQDGEVAKSGDMGWTWGKATFTVYEDDSAQQKFYSKYLNVWVKDKEGKWKVKVDMGNEREGE